jgi:hypothetical protein
VSWRPGSEIRPQHRTRQAALLRPSARGGREVEPVAVPRGWRREVPGDRRGVCESVASRSSKGDSCGFSDMRVRQCAKESSQSAMITSRRFQPAGMRNYRTSGDGLANGRARPFAALQDRPRERARSARERTLAEGVGFHSSGCRVAWTKRITLDKTQYLCAEPLTEVRSTRSIRSVPLWSPAGRRPAGEARVRLLS